MGIVWKENGNRGRSIKSTGKQYVKEYAVALGSRVEPTKCGIGMVE